VVEIDVARIRQVLRNLLSNAIKFAPASSAIGVKISENIDCTITVSARDEGSGIPEDEIESVFEKFVRSSDTKTGAGGTGLGLAICRQIVTAHGAQSVRTTMMEMVLP
jgi:signal transduction histidine kinase